MKESDDIFGVWGGVAGAQSLLPAVFTGATTRAAGALDVHKIAGFVVWRLSARPAKRFGLWPRKGAIAQGSDADIVLFDPDREWTLASARSQTRGVDPYVGRSFRGKVVRTLVGGRTVYKEERPSQIGRRAIHPERRGAKDTATTTRELVEIDERRLLRRLDDLAQRGALPSGGIYRPLYSPAWSSAMDLVAGWMKDAGLLVRRDGVGNVWGRIEGSRGGRVIATGSHIDTVRGGGALDGALGVVAGIEAVAVSGNDPGGNPNLECVAIAKRRHRFDTNLWGARGSPSARAGRGRRVREQDG